MMRFDPREYTVKELVSAWKDNSLRRNDEYQRGAEWSDQQQQAFIDSIFRGYPLPALFLQKIEGSGLGGAVTQRFDVVDGQQRILTLVRFLEDKFPLL
ncbi:MAG TPA: DUF262 domain-containing protein, partial [Phycisphaerae bacterium]